MQRSKYLIVSGGVIACALALASSRALTQQPSPKSAQSGNSPPAADDPALLHQRLLARLDAAVVADATRGHLEARLMLADVCPVPYLGLDASAAPGGVKVDAVYANTGAERAGLAAGDLLQRIDDDVTDSKTSLARTVRRHRVGQTVKLVVKRGGADLTLTATIGPRPEEDEDEEEQFPDLPRRVSTTATIALDFEQATAGVAPPGMDSVLGGHGHAGNWLVLQEAGQRFVRQTEGDPTGIRFPMLLVRGLDSGDLVATVRFRYVAGHVDRAAGLVLRYQDPGNYMLARANAAEADLRIFRVVNGLRTTLPGGIAAYACDDDRWHSLEFRCEGPRLTATIDGKATTSSYDTFFLHGGGGIWTKSDSQADFDDLHFEPIVAAGASGTPSKR